MDVSETRYRNFKHLFEQFKEATRKDDPGAPEKGMLKQFGERVGVREAYMSHINTKYKGIGSATARKIEQAFGLSHGWMDQQQKEPPKPEQQQQGGEAPIDGLQRLFEWCRQIDAAKTHAALHSLVGELTAIRVKAPD